MAPKGKAKVKKTDDKMGRAKKDLQSPQDFTTKWCTGRIWFREDGRLLINGPLATDGTNLGSLILAWSDSTNHKIRPKIVVARESKAKVKKTDVKKGLAKGHRQQQEIALKWCDGTISFTKNGHLIIDGTLAPDGTDLGDVILAWRANHRHDRTNIRVRKEGSPLGDVDVLCDC